MARFSVRLLVCGAIGVAFLVSTAWAARPANSFGFPPAWKTRIAPGASTVTVTTELSCVELPDGTVNGPFVATFTCVIQFIAAGGGVISMTSFTDAAGGQRVGGAQTFTRPPGTEEVRVLCTGNIDVWGDASNTDTTVTAP